MFRLWAASAGQRLTCALCQRQLRAQGQWEGFDFLSLSQAAKPGTWGQNYSSHRAARQQEEGALRAEKENKEKKKTFPASRSERARQVGDRCDPGGWRLPDAGWRASQADTAFSLQGVQAELKGLSWKF